MSAILLDTESVCRIAERNLAEAGLADRTECIPCDMFTDPWPAEVDYVLFAQILHDWPPERCAPLLRKAHEALRPGGQVLVSEKLISEDGRSPLPNLLVNLDMLFWTEGRQFRGSEVVSMLSSAGFEGASVEPTLGYWSLVRATKAGAPGRSS